MTVTHARLQSTTVLSTQLPFLHLQSSRLMPATAARRLDDPTIVDEAIAKVDQQIHKLQILIQGQLDEIDALKKTDPHDSLGYGRNLRSALADAERSLKHCEDEKQQLLQKKAVW